ncbi:hypothetical protein [Duncaniella muris]|uniref:hypothetical protein n=1 Tax=Duncaniella muris TaxID=2094150 RepID=UPI0025B0A595|nr:hypothetical protein [Duncaniella muris]
MSLLKAKPYKTVECGGFIANFYYKEGNWGKTYLEITTVSGVWSMRIAGNTHAYGYLLEAANQEKVEQIHGYAAMLFILSQQFTQDQGLTDDVVRGINKWQKRMDTKAQEAAKNVSAAEEVASQAVMEDVAAYADATPKERKKMRKANKAAMRDVLNEKESENGE